MDETLSERGWVDQFIFLKKYKEIFCSFSQRLIFYRITTENRKYLTKNLVSVKYIHSARRKQTMQSSILDLV